MPKPVSTFFYTYTLLWRAAQPCLFLFPRLRQGWKQRTLADIASTEHKSFDIWIQAASGGEALLANMVLERLLKENDLCILATSGTTEGVETLTKSSVAKKLAIRYFPLDNPKIMEQAFTSFCPKLAILVETELWPGFLMTATTHNVPVLVINGRMSVRSHRSYSKMRPFFQRFSPDYVVAMSEDDGKRYADLIGKNRVTIVPNLKFDRVFQQNTTPPLQPLHPEGSQFVVFGSVRKEEEKAICACIAKLLAENRAHRPCVPAIFPKHVQRVHALSARLEHLSIPYTRRSLLSACNLARENSVIIWDSFGELSAAYALADAAFVGGSLCKWGGHNILEPLSYGVCPILGRHWHNFAWIGRWIVEQGFVYEIVMEDELLAQLQENLAKKENRNRTIEKLQTAVAPFQGGTAITCNSIMQRLTEVL